MTYIWPVPDALSRVTQEFNNAQHTGMDFKGDTSTPIYAEADGVIVYEGVAENLGWPNQWAMMTNAIKAGAGGNILCGLDVGPYQFWHAHMSSTVVNTGDHVKQGQLLGYIGNTGYSFGNHLHLDVLPDGWNLNSADGLYGRVNPRDVIDGFATAAPQGNPVSVVAGPNQRETVSQGVNRRSAPDKNSQLIEHFGPELILTFRGFVQPPGAGPYGDGNNVWFVGAFGDPTYFHSSGFQDQGTHDLPDLTAQLGFAAPPPPVVSPTPPEKVTPPPAIPQVYDFPLDFPIINGIRVEKFAAALSNVDVGNFPAAPGTLACHWWNSLEANPSIEGVISRFQRHEAFASAHFAVDVDRILQFVSLRDRAYHAGPSGNGFYSVEVSPFAIERGPDGQYTEKARKIQANVRDLVRLLQEREGREITLVKHKDIPGNATKCSDLDLSTFKVLSPEPVPVEPPRVTPPPVVVVTPGLTPNQTVELAALANYLIERTSK